MLNYLSAEWYKLRRTKGIFLAFGLLLALIAMVFVPSFWYRKPTFGIYAMAYLVSLILGFFLAPVFAVRAFDDQYGRGTLKNEIVFGIPRQRIYLGKLLLGGATGTAAALIVLVFYLLLGLLTGGGEGQENALVYAELCLRGTLIVLPLWLASLSLTFCLLALIRSSAGAIALNYIFLFLTTPLALLAPGTHTDSHVWNFFSYWHFVSPFRMLYESVDGEPILPTLGWSLAVGVGWIVATTAVGLAVFNRREIK